MLKWIGSEKINYRDGLTILIFYLFRSFYNSILKKQSIH